MRNNLEKNAVSSIWVKLSSARRNNISSCGNMDGPGLKQLLAAAQSSEKSAGILNSVFIVVAAMGSLAGEGSQLLFFVALDG